MALASGRLTLTVGSYGVNCTIFWRGGAAWIVDPGAEGERIEAALAERSLSPAAILLTHAHFDHIGAIAYLQKSHPGLAVCIHGGDLPMLGHPMNANPPDYPPAGRPKNVVVLGSGGDDGLCGGAKVLHTPGHSPGSVCYYLEDEALVFTGDTLFAGSAGRTDLPGGSMTQLMRSLDFLRTLPDATIVVPGHGAHTTIGKEKNTNPFFL